MDSRRPAQAIDLSSLPVAPTIVIPLDHFGADTGSTMHLLNGLTGPRGPEGPQIAVQVPAEVAAQIDQQLQEALEDIRRTMQVLDEASAEAARRLGLASSPFHHTMSNASVIAIAAGSGLGGHGAAARRPQAGSSFLVMPRLPLFDFDDEMDDDEFLRDLRRRNRTCLDDAVLRALLS